MQFLLTSNYLICKYINIHICGRKLIGARYYGVMPDSSSSSNSSAAAFQAPSGGSPRDTVGHGTHTASTAGGAVVADADYYGLAGGAAKGGAPASRVAVYRACSLGGCASSSVLKAIDDAVADGVDVVSVSIGIGSAFQSDLLSDPIALGAFHAHRKGVLVVCSAGNDGPHPYTVVNTAPWVLTVAASSIDRTFQSTITLGDGTALKVTKPKMCRHLIPMLTSPDRAREWPLTSPTRA